MISQGTALSWTIVLLFSSLSIQKTHRFLEEAVEYMLRKVFPVILLALVMLPQTSPAPLRALELGPAGLVPVSIPTGASPVTPITQADLDGNGTLESLVLTGGHLSILSGSGIVWQSPPAWQIAQAAISDLDRDGKPEVTLLLWRPFRPWPADQWLPNGGRISGFHDAKGQSCHIILIGWRGGGYRELWAGSAMVDPITSFAVADLEGKGTQVLVALESRYTAPRSAPARTLKVWEWNGFGFSVVSYINGTFSELTLVQADNGHILVLVP